MIIQGNYIDKIKYIPNRSVDAIITDPPYNMTKNEWDGELDYDTFFTEVWRVLKPNGVLIVFGQDKFSAKTMLADPNHKYNLIWEKDRPTQFLDAKKKPMKSHEDIMVFCRGGAYLQSSNEGRWEAQP